MNVILVFGVATSVSAIHSKLPHHVSSHLSIDIFAGQKSTDLLSKVIEEILLNPDIKFKLGGKILEMLLDNFLLSDFSVKRFLFGYKYTLMEHQFNDPESVELDKLRSLRSFRKYIEADVKSRAALLMDDKSFRRFFEEALEELDAVTRRYQFGVKCLHLLTKDLPGAPMGRQIFSVYRTCLLDDVLESHEYRESFQFLNHMSADSLKEKLISFVTILEDTEYEDNGKELLQKLDKPEEVKVLYEKKELEAFKKKISREDLKKHLLDSALEKKKMLSPFEQLKKSILDYFHRTLKKLLQVRKH